MDKLEEIKSLELMEDIPKLMYAMIISSLKFPKEWILKKQGMDLEKTAPLLCAGITMYDPLRHWGFTKGQ